MTYLKKRMSAEVTTISNVLRHGHCSTKGSLPVRNETVSYEATKHFSENFVRKSFGQNIFVKKRN
jgi:hypothetical protein